MARFPFRPGAGAKAIRNPVYWNRLYLQETESTRASYTTSGPSRGALLARWYNINANYNFFADGWLDPIFNNWERLSPKDQKGLERAIDSAEAERGTCAKLLDAIDHSQLTKFAARVRKVMLLGFQLTVDLDLFEDDEPRLISFSYEARYKKFRLVDATGNVSFRYYMGKLDSEQYAETRELYQRSVEARKNSLEHFLNK